MSLIVRLWLAYPFRMPCSRIVAVCNIHKQEKPSILCHWVIPFQKPPIGRVILFGLMCVSRSNMVSIPCVQLAAVFAYFHLKQQTLKNGECSSQLFARKMFVNLYSSYCRFINYGNVQTKPIIKDGQLSLRHESSTPCDKNSSMTYTSVIYFFCDRNAYVRIQYIRSEYNG